MAQVLVLSLVFAPDGVSGAQLMSELVSDIDHAGHRVSVVTTQPHYSRDIVAEAAQPLRRRWVGLFYQSEFREIPVLHAPMGRKRGGISRRMWGWLKFHLFGLFAGLFLVERPDVVLVPSPLLTAGAVGWFIARMRGAAFVYNVQDLYPDLAIKLGYIRNPLLIRILFALERFVYARADAVTVIGEGMRRAIIAKGIPAEKVHLIPNFVDLGELAPGPRWNAFREECGLGDSFVVSYAGNIGFAQGLDLLIDAAERLKDDTRVRFLLVGDGVHRSDLARRAGTRGLQNVIFVDYQPYARMPEIYAASDLCVVALSHVMSTEAIPSKVLRIMASGRPVLAMTSATSDLAIEVTEAGAGVVVSSSSAIEVARAISELADSPERCAAAGNAGRAWAEGRYGRSVVTGQYTALLVALANRRAVGDQ